MTINSASTVLTRVPCFLLRRFAISPHFAAVVLLVGYVFNAKAQRMEGSFALAAASCCQHNGITGAIAILMWQNSGSGFFLRQLCHFVMAESWQRWRWWQRPER